MKLNNMYNKIKYYITFIIYGIVFVLIYSCARGLVFNDFSFYMDLTIIDATEKLLFLWVVMIPIIIVPIVFKLNLKLCLKDKRITNKEINNIYKKIKVLIVITIITLIIVSVCVITKDYIKYLEDKDNIPIDFGYDVNDSNTSYYMKYEFEADLEEQCEFMIYWIIVLLEHLILIRIMKKEIYKYLE